MTVRSIAGRLAGNRGRRWYRIAAAVTAVVGLAALLVAAYGQLLASGSAGLPHP